MYPVFHVPAGDVLPVMFATYDKDDGSSITMSGLAVTDIEIYKDGSVTQRSSDAGYTLLDTDGIDFDGLTGIHGFSIDTGDNTDSGFYTVGAWFTVVVSAVTVDAVSISFIACQFRLMAAESIAAKPKVDVDAWLGTAAATPTVAGVPEVDLTHVGGATTNVAALATNVDAILTDTGTTLQAELDGIQADTEDIQSRLPAALVGGRIDATVDGTGLEAAAAAVIADAVWDEAATGHTDAGKAGEQLWTDIDAVLVDTSTTLQGELDGIQADTEDIQSRLPAALTGDGNIKADTLKIEGADPTDTINAQADLALSDYDPPTRAELTTDINSVLTRLRGLILANGTIGSTGNDTTHVHLAGLTYGNDEIVGYYLTIFDVSESEYHVREITDWVLATELATVATLPFTPQNATDLFYILAAQAAAGGSAPTAAEVADAVWDEAQADHVGAGTFGEIATEVASILDDTDLIDDGTSGLAKIATDVAAILVDTGTTLQGELDGIQADTEDIQSKIGTPAGASVSADIAAVKAETASILDDTDLIDDGTSGLAKIATDVAAILVDTGTTLQAELDGIQADTEDIQSRIPAALTANGNMKSSLLEIISTALSEGATGRLATAWQKAWNVASSVWTSADINQTGDNYARIGAPAGASVSADIAAVKSQTAAIETDTQDIQSKIGTPAGASVSADIADVEGKVDDLETRLGTPSDLGSGATVAANLVDIEAQTDDIGTAGAGLTAVPWNAAWDAEVQSEVADALGVYDPPTKAELDSAVAPLALEATAQEILTDTGTSIPATLSTIAGYIDTEVAAILADTNELQTDWVDGGRLDLLIDAIKAKTDSLTFTVANQVDANALTLDEDEILDDLLADSVPADGSLPTVRQAIYMILQFLLERSVSGTTLTVKKVDGSTSLMTFTLNDASEPTSITRSS